MHVLLRSGSGLLLLFCGFSSLTAQGTIENNPRVVGPFESLRSEFDEARRSASEAMRAATSEDARRQVFESLWPRPETWAPKFLELAKSVPASLDALSALTWVIRETRSPTLQDEALSALRSHHVTNAEVVATLEPLTLSVSPLLEGFLNEVAEKNTEVRVRKEARLVLARNLLFREQLGRRARTEPPESSGSRSLIRNYGQTLVTQLASIPEGTLESQAEPILVSILERASSQDLEDPASPESKAKSELHELKNLRVGSLAPDIEGEDLNGAKLRLSSFRGKIVILDFWGAWSGTSQAIWPTERALLKRFEGRPVVIVGVSSDADREDLRAAMSREQLSWTTFFDGGTLGPITSAWNVRQWPTLYVLDAGGRIQAKHVRASDLESIVARLLQDPKGKSK